MENKESNETETRKDETLDFFKEVARDLEKAPTRLPKDADYAFRIGDINARVWLYSPVLFEVEVSTSPHGKETDYKPVNTSYGEFEACKSPAQCLMDTFDDAVRKLGATIMEVYYVRKYKFDAEVLVEGKKAT